MEVQKRLKSSAKTAEQTPSQFLCDMALRILLTSLGVNALGALIVELGVLVSQPVVITSAAATTHRMSVRDLLDIVDGPNGEAEPQPPKEKRT